MSWTDDLIDRYDNYLRGLLEPAQTQQRNQLASLIQGVAGLSELLKALSTRLVEQGNQTDSQDESLARSMVVTIDKLLSIDNAVTTQTKFIDDQQKLIHDFGEMVLTALSKLGVLLTQLGVQLGKLESKPKPKFAVFNQTIWPELSAVPGVRDDCQWDDRRMWSGSVPPLPDALEAVDVKAIQAMVEFWRDKGVGKICVDIEDENWSILRASPKYSAAHDATLHILRSLAASGLEVGLYGSMPDGSQSWQVAAELAKGQTGALTVKWRADNDANRWLVNSMDFFNPSFYCPAGYSWPDWRFHAEVVLRECARLAPGKPVYPDLSPQIAGDNQNPLWNDFTRAIRWLSDRARIVGDVHGCIIWQWPQPSTTLPAFDPAWAWVKAIQQATA